MCDISFGQDKQTPAVKSPAEIPTVHSKSHLAAAAPSNAATSTNADQALMTSASEHDLMALSKRYQRFEYSAVHCNAHAPDAQSAHAPHAHSARAPPAR